MTLHQASIGSIVRMKQTLSCLPDGLELSECELADRMEIKPETLKNYMQMSELFGFRRVVGKMGRKLITRWHNGRAK